MSAIVTAIRRFVRRLFCEHVKAWSPHHTDPYCLRCGKWLKR